MEVQWKGTSGRNLRHRKEGKKPGQAVYKWRGGATCAALDMSLVEGVMAGCSKEQTLACTEEMEGQTAETTEGLAIKSDCVENLPIRTNHTQAPAHSSHLRWLQAISDASQKPGRRAIDLCASSRMYQKCFGLERTRRCCAPAAVRRSTNAPRRSFPVLRDRLPQSSHTNAPRDVLQEGELFLFLSTSRT
jgi:hypothetical protein